MLYREQFPLVLSYGMTVHKSQGLTLSDGCVFDILGSRFARCLAWPLLGCHA